MGYTYKIEFVEDETSSLGKFTTTMPIEGRGRHVEAEAIEESIRQHASVLVDAYDLRVVCLEGQNTAIVFDEDKEIARADVTGPFEVV